MRVVLDKTNVETVYPVLVGASNLGIRVRSVHWSLEVIPVTHRTCHDTVPMVLSHKVSIGHERSYAFS